MLLRACHLDFCRWPILAMAVWFLSQCTLLDRFGSPSQRGRQNADQEASASPGSEQEGDFRLVAMDETPFFRWLRSGLRSEAKPTRFLDQGMKVEMLEEKEEQQFSQVRLPDGKKGWVPSRLVRQRVGRRMRARPGRSRRACVPRKRTRETPAIWLPNCFPNPVGRCRR